MATRYKQPKILTLYGVKLDDYKPAEKIFKEQILENAGLEKRDLNNDSKTNMFEKYKDNQIDTNITKIYDTIPSFFTTIEKWPTTTNLKCWSCNLKFTTPPRFLPERANIIGESKYELEVEGNMCSFPCVEAYIQSKYKTEIERNHARQLMFLLYSLWTGEYIYHIEAPWPKTVMTCYGGTKTVEEYRNMIKERDPILGAKTTI